MADVGVGREFYTQLRNSLAAQLPAFLMKQRWFGGKARKINSAELTDVIPIPVQSQEALQLTVTVRYADNTDESYAVPVLRVADATSVSGGELSSLKVQTDAAATPVVLTDALKNEEFLYALLEMIQGKVTLRGERGELRALQTAAFSRLYPSSTGRLKPRPAGAEQSNTSVIYGSHLIMKLFRRIQEGINPDLEIGKFLTEKTSFASVPLLAGSLEYHTRDGKRSVQGILQQFVPNEGDAWSYTLRSLAEFYDGVGRHLSKSGVRSSGESRGEDPGVLEFASAAVVPYLGSAELLGQ